MRKFITILFLLILSLTTAFACSDTPSSNEENYQIQINQVENVTISVQGGLTQALPGEEITFVITCQEGYELVSFTINQTEYIESIVDNKVTITMPNTNVSVTAKCTNTYYSINAETPTNGSILVSDTSAPSGKIITLTATPNEGYKLDSILVTSNGNTITVTDNQFIMPAGNVNICATFKLVSLNVIKGTASNGSFTIDKTTASYGETITLTNTPDVGYKFSHYDVGGTKITTNTFTMPNNDVTITAVFIKESYTITVSTVTGGTIKVDKTTAYYGDTITLSNTPSDGYKFANYSVNGTTQTATTFTMPAKNTTVSGSFTKISYTITVSTVTGGTIKVDKTTATVGDTITLSNTPSAGYKFASYTVNGTSQTATTFTMPAKNTTVSGSFTKISYTITVSTVTGGTIKVDKTTATVGDIITLSNTPSTGYKFVNYSVNGTNQTATTFTMPAKNTTVSGSFTKISYTITKSSVSNGTLTVNKTTAYYGDTVTLSNSANAGYVFSTYTVNGTNQTANTFKMPAKNTTVGVTFVKGIGGLSNFNYTGIQHGNNTTGSLTINGNGITSTHRGAPYAYGRVNGDFYFETKILTKSTDIYVTDIYRKFGIAVNVGKDNFFFFVDAYSTGYNNGGYGTNTWSCMVNGYGEDVPNSEWYWGQKTGEVGSKNFGLNYNNTYLHMAVMRVGGIYHFFINNAYSHSLYYPNMTETANVGILAFEMGYTVKDSKFGTGSTVINNAKHYYGIQNSSKVTSITLDGATNDWKENASNSYGFANDNRFFYASAFVSGDYVYALVQGRTSNYITNATNWWENTNVEFRRGIDGTEDQMNATQMFAAANGQMAGVSEFKHVVENEGAVKRITFEVKIPKSLWGSNAIKIGFAFKSGDPLWLSNNAEPSSDWWCGFAGINWQKLSVSSTGLSSYKNEDVPNDPIIKTGANFADPFVMEYNGTYYMYGTTSTTNYVVRTSTDLINWSGTTEIFNLKTANSFANRELWAPEVRYNSSTKKFVMMYSGSYGGTGLTSNNTDRPWCPKVGVATSDSPKGPFVDVYGAPLLYPNEEKSTIDGSIFVDTNGQAYLYYCLDSHTNWSEEYIDSVNNGHFSEICVVKLDSTWTKTVGEHTKLVKPELAWEKSSTPYTAEGPYVYKHSNSKYYLTYSCNVAWDQNYGVGLAISNSPTGPFTKLKDPIVAKDPGITAGTGHSMMFKDKNGNLWCAFHTFTDPNWTRPEGSNSWPKREALLARAYFKDGIMKVAYKNEIVKP